MNRTRAAVLGAVCLAGYIGTIAAANWAVQRYGVVPVGFGLAAPAGVWFAGLAFTLRDLAQDLICEILTATQAERDRLRAEVEAHEGEMGDLRASLAAAETETDRLRAELERRDALLSALVGLDPCQFSHLGGCLEHGFPLEPGEKCPHQEAKDLLDAGHEEADHG